MSDRRRVHRQPCCLKGQIFVPQISDPIRCTITDISSLGAFVRLDTRRTITANFNLTIGGSSLPRACRVARREADGFGGEFLDPVRHEVEEILSEHAFKEELLFEALSSALDEEATVTKVRLRRTTNAIIELIERRSAMTWQSTDIVEQHALRRLLTC